MIPKNFSEVWKRSIMSQTPKITIDDVIEAKNGNNTGTVIFLHGAGGSGHLIKEWIELLKNDIAFPHLKIIFPTAPLRPYTAHGGMMENVWFDRKKTDISDSEHVETLNQAAEGLKEIIQKEIDSGIPAEKIIVGGFSMGGSMSLHMGYRIMPNIGGVFALSSFLNNDTLVYKELERSKPSKLPVLFYSHGDKDDLVFLKWGQQTFQKLQKLGVEGTFNIKQNAFHELKRKELNSLWQWIEDITKDK